MPLAGWSLVIWAGVALVALVAMVRLMSQRRAALEDQFRTELEAEKARRRAAERAAKKKKKSA